MDALLPLACLPVEIAGRNRMWRKMAIDLIRMDPEWKGGEYTAPPKVGLTGAAGLLLFIAGSPLLWQQRAPNRVKADSVLESRINRALTLLEANDLIYQLEASRHYNPSPHLSKIQAPLFAVNFADDEVAPPELKIMEQEIVKVKQGRYILHPISEQTIGHSTCMLPEIWGVYLKELLELTNKK
jgi:homoserine O-acetyltransferase